MAPNQPPMPNIPPQPMMFRDGAQFAQRQQPDQMQQQQQQPPNLLSQPLHSNQQMGPGSVGQQMGPASIGQQIPGGVNQGMISSNSNVGMMPGMQSQFKFHLNQVYLTFLDQPPLPHLSMPTSMAQQPISTGSYPTPPPFSSQQAPQQQGQVPSQMMHRQFMQGNVGPGMHPHQQQMQQQFHPGMSSQMMPPSYQQQMMQQQMGSHPSNTGLPQPPPYFSSHAG